jgi:hypothetical protein
VVRIFRNRAAFAVRLLRLDQKLMDGIPMNPRRLANVLILKPELLREFCGHLTKPGDETRHALRGRHAGRDTGVKNPF